MEEYFIIYQIASGDTLVVRSENLDAALGLVADALKDGAVSVEITTQDPRA
ncbi:hypothetical protein [uncultured Tateyamaria sp.]|uniref:hypothetical protein n=1 Tax=uncultured Tateyamaria sp. TaxID=455651 RepID=UPI002604B1CE|nr:hypothetical protein [uncultured Tateyamaria sp.]